MMCRPDVPAIGCLVVVLAPALYSKALQLVFAGGCKNTFRDFVYGTWFGLPLTAVTGGAPMSVEPREDRSRSPIVLLRTLTAESLKGTYTLAALLQARQNKDVWAPGHSRWDTIMRHVISRGLTTDALGHRAPG